MEQEAVARAAASAIVEAELRGPIAYIEGAVVRLRSDDSGTILLPFQPAFNVSSIVYDSGQSQDMSTVTVDGNWVSGLARIAWVTATYDHGWTDATTPKIVRVIVDSLTYRLQTTPASNLKSEKIGAYEVEYDVSPRWLLDDEKLALSRCMRNTAGMTASASTSTDAPDLGPFGLNGLGWGYE